MAEFSIDISTMELWGYYDSAGKVINLESIIRHTIEDNSTINHTIEGTSIIRDTIQNE